ncbi:hypothetical protein [Leeuwenhoekiella nanhaiensis]|uniref:Viral A-type inclusion protein n=1 Tax=Leeuwenhoekiella nanhaiensis TaxID=1655491 RepID=A0A2G1VSY1_9FLAO|nr:hypothetical protein [Leeuwenhoekiella nanhaiensis]PHQ29887.1 hypothetical protein CJ305_07920 [Leeuwenhoekiella nanhaiensis]
MKILKYVLVFGMVLSTLLACDNQSEQRDQYNALFAEVIAIHDELMPQMTTISNIQSQLKATDSVALSVPKQELLEQANTADSVMMTWMHSFTDTYVKNRVPVAEMSPEQLKAAVNGLQEELQEIKELRDLTQNCIAKSKELLK